MNLNPGFPGSVVVVVFFFFPKKKILSDPPIVNYIKCVVIFYIMNIFLKKV